MFTQPVSMQCTQEQYEKDLKQPLLEMGYHGIDLTNWNIHPYLVTNYTGVKNVVSNMDNTVCESYGRYFIDHYNPELFLALAAMTEKRVVEGGELGNIGEWITPKSRKYGERYVQIEERRQFFNDAWRKATKEELIEKFTKQKEMEKDLRELLHSGDIVELSNGDMGIVIDTRVGKLIQFENSYTEVMRFDKNLRAVTTMYDIIKIRRISLGMQIIPMYWEEAPIIWERKETKEMTLDELIKEAGYEEGEIKVKVE